MEMTHCIRSSFILTRTSLQLVSEAYDDKA
jgi:hypothetical protein